MELRTLIDAYIDVNILLVVSLCLWFAARRILASIGLPNGFTTQLKLLKVLILATIVSPILAATIPMIFANGLFGSAFSVNISDFVTAQYLNGSIQMAPSAFEGAIGFRGRLMSGVQYLDTTLGIAIVAFLAVGFGLAVLRLGLGICNLCRVVSASTVWRRFGRLELRVSDTTTIPFSTRTFQRQIIVIPSSIIARPRDLKIALSHEIQHFRQRDLDWEICLEFLKPFFFWNPAFSIWKRQFEILRELSCDQQVLSRQTVVPAEYCESLLRICADGLKPKRLFFADVPKVTLVETRKTLFGRNSAALLRQRLNSMFHGNPERHPRTVFAMTIVPLLAITLVSSLAIQKPDDWSHDRLMLSTIVNLERLAARNSASAIGFGRN